MSSNNKSIIIDGKEIIKGKYIDEELTWKYININQVSSKISKSTALCISQKSNS